MTPTHGRNGLTSFRQPPVPAAGSSTAVRVLIVEDNPRDAELLTETLSETAADGRAFSLLHVATLTDACAALAEWPADVVLLDLSLPDSRGLESLDVVRTAAPDVPVVVMTGLDDDAVALRAMQAGAQDYLVKGRDEEEAIRRAIRYAIERQQLMRVALEATRARDEVLAVVSHDLRNPLHTISMCAQALLDPAPRAPDHAQRMGDIIQRSCDWMERLISDLLDVTRLESGTLALHVETMLADGVVGTLDAFFGLLAAEQGTTLLTVVEPDLPWLQADADRLVQALGNLVGNALKFTPAGGRVTLVAERADASVDGAAGVAGVRFRVADTGCGIAPEHLTRIFDRFWQVQEMRRGGAGLGLAIAKGIVEAHGGTIEVESVRGAGTTFTFTLPAVPSAEVPATP